MSKPKYIVGQTVAVTDTLGTEEHASDTTLAQIRDLLTGDPWGLKVEDRQQRTEADVEAEVVDMVNHPSHYNGHPKGIEAIDYIEDNPFPNLANAQRYLHRVSWGGKWDNLEDLHKAVWYVKREIQRRESRPEEFAA